MKIEVDGLNFGNRTGRTWVRLHENRRESQLSRMAPGFPVKTPGALCYHQVPATTEPILQQTLSPGERMENQCWLSRPET